MDARSAYERKDHLVFLDVREQFEWDAGHIEDSLHIPLAEIPVRYAELATDTSIVAVCHVGQRSELAAQFLRERGFEVDNLEGGMAAWASEQLPYVSAAGGPGFIVG